MTRRVPAFKSPNCAFRSPTVPVGGQCSSTGANSAPFKSPTAPSATAPAGNAVGEGDARVRSHPSRVQPAVPAIQTTGSAGGNLGRRSLRQPENTNRHGLVTWIIPGRPAACCPARSSPPCAPLPMRQGRSASRCRRTCRARPCCTSPPAPARVAAAGVDDRLAVQREVVGVFRHHHVGDQARPRQPALDRQRGHGREILKLTSEARSTRSGLPGKAAASEEDTD